MDPTLTHPSAVLDLQSRKDWTREDCQFLEEQGLVEAGRYELIEGELVFPVKKRPPIITMRTCTTLLMRIFGEDRVNVEAPVDLRPEDNPRNAPEADIVVLRCPDVALKTDNPQPADIALLVEISDSSVDIDLGKKATLYARAGLAEYWVIDLNERRVVVHRTPAGNMFGSVVSLRQGDRISPLGRPQVSVEIADLFFKD